MTSLEKKQRNRYDEEFKRNAVRMLLDSKKPVTTIANQLGIEQSNLHKWSKRYGQELMITGHDGSNNVSLKEILRLKQEICEIKATLETLRVIILKSMGDKYL